MLKAFVTLAKCLNITQNAQLLSVTRQTIRRHIDEFERLREENPGASEFDLTVKAIGLAGAETVFSAIGSGTLGKVYKDILLKEGSWFAPNVMEFSHHLQNMFKNYKSYETY